MGWNKKLESKEAKNLAIILLIVTIMTSIIS